MKKIAIIALAILTVASLSITGAGAYKYHTDNLAWQHQNKQQQDKITALQSKVDYESKQIKGLQDSISTPAKPSVSICAALGCGQTTLSPPAPIPAPVVSPSHCSSTTYGIDNQFTDTNCY